MAIHHPDNKNILLYNEEEFKCMQRACDLTTAILDEIAAYVKPGVNTEYLDNLISKWILDNDAQPACLGYKGYPKTICTSINGVVCHGIPKKTAVLKNGDIINIDITVIRDGWYGDSSRMYYVGEVPKYVKDLCERTYESLERAIAIVKDGVQQQEIGGVIEDYLKPFGYGIVKGYCGHGVGKEFHRSPNINHHRDKSDTLILKEGMIFTIEPMINLGSAGTKCLADGWTVLTVDGKPSAQFEHTIGVLKDGCRVFTRSKIGFNKPENYDLEKLKNRECEFRFDSL
jgi:methionyl aminopeptidase